MAKFWTGMILPLAIAGAVAAQTVGVEVNRSAHLYRALSLQRDTVALDSLPPAADTLHRPDTLVPPDSLTPPVPADSLPAIDSLQHRADSIERMLAAMTKSERKRWIYENVELPKILRKQDSLFRIQDSIQRVKDSIVHNTPRILETAFLPDSLYYKRLVSWRHNRLNNRIDTFEWDTTANYHFYDYPFLREDVGASWLGMPGAAVQTYNYFLRDAESSPAFYQPVECWTYTPENLPFFNTKTPYTELEYSGHLFSNSTLSQDNFRVFTTQNILPELNIALEMKRYGGAGTLQREETKNNSYFVSGNYVGKKYLAHGGFIYNRVERQESGGVKDNKWVRDTVVDVREISVNLAQASSRYRKRTFFFDQSYRIPFEFLERLRHRGDTTWTPSDSLNRNLTTGFIGTSSEYSTYTRKYVDVTSADLSTFYNNVFYVNPKKSADSLRVSRLENRLFIRLQPWHEDAIVSKLEGGVGNRLQHFYLATPVSALYKADDHRWNSFYAYAGAEGRLSRYFSWDATGLLNFAGEEAGDFFVKAGARLSFFPFRRDRKSPVTLGARFQTSLTSPDFYTQHFYSNHFKWDNNFGKISSTRLEASLEIPRWRLRAQAGYALIGGLTYYDSQGIAQQHGDAVNVFIAGLSHHLVLGPVHLENSALVQMSSAPAVLPLPALALNARYYVQFNVVDASVLRMQVGLNTRYVTEWYVPWYNPVAGMFTLQNQLQYGNTPITDIFVNMQWKKCCIFLKYENAGRGWPSKAHDFFTAHHYIQTAPALRFGISWPFYPNMGQVKTLSSRAGASLGSASR